MKQPKSSNSGTTGAWKEFVDNVNKMGEDEAEKRRNKLKNINKKPIKKK